MNLLDKAKSYDVNFFLSAVSIFVISICVALALPAFSIWLGLPPEGDAVDYRVPMIKWILSHGAFPAWPWSMVDDYPSLAELFLAGLYWVHPNLMRLAPLGAYVGVGYVAGKIAAEFWPESTGLSRRCVSLLAFAWILGLRPLTIQANLLMVDNISSFFILASLLFIFRDRPLVAGVLNAFALAIRYSAWPVAPALALCLFAQSRGKRRFTDTFIFTLISTMGAAPTMIRNWMMNRNPFFPMADSFFGGHLDDSAYFIYGRGTDLTSFLLLPYDMLYTNSFVQAYFDYTLGKLFYIQLAAAIIFLALSRRKLVQLAPRLRVPVIVFCAFHLMSWFAISQQMRFLVPFLVLIDIWLLLVLVRKSNAWVVGVVTMLTVFSAASIQKDSILMALGKTEGLFAERAQAASHCLRNVSADEPVGFMERDGVLGFLGHDFVFLPPHPYATAAGQEAKASLNYIYTQQKVEGFEAWPKEAPCLMKRVKVEN